MEHELCMVLADKNIQEILCRSLLKKMMFLLMTQKLLKHFESGREIEDMIIKKSRFKTKHAYIFDTFD